jgi:hypothetical protein
MGIHKAALLAPQLLTCVTIIRSAARYTGDALSAKSFSLCCRFGKKNCGTMDNIGKLAESTFQSIALLEGMSYAKDVNNCETAARGGLLGTRGNRKAQALKP